MILNLSSTGTLTTIEARERIQLGIDEGAFDIDHMIDLEGVINLNDPLWSLFYGFGIYFQTTDKKVSFYPDGSVEANEFLEGVRTYIDDIGRFSVVFLREIE